jgi:hypothetical protein
VAGDEPSELWFDCLFGQIRGYPIRCIVELGGSFVRQNHKALLMFPRIIEKIQRLIGSVALCNRLPIGVVESMWRSGRVVECYGLENHSVVLPF